MHLIATDNREQDSEQFYINRKLEADLKHSLELRVIKALAGATHVL